MADIIKFKPKPTELDRVTNKVLFHLDNLLGDVDDDVRMAVSIALIDKTKAKRVISVDNKTKHAQITKYPPPKTKE